MYSFLSDTSAQTPTFVALKKHKLVFFLEAIHRGGAVPPSLTQHALRRPGVVVPGAHAVLHRLGDGVGVHVGHAAVHGRAEVRLARRRRPDDVSHLIVRERVQKFFFIIIN